MAYDTPEGRIKKQGRVICTELELYHYPVNQGGMSENGIPDDAVVAWGPHLQIEYKADMDWTKLTKTAFKSLPSEKQVQHMERCRASGGITFLVDKHNLHTLRGCLINIKLLMDKIPYMNIPGGMRTPMQWVQQAAMRSPCGFDWSLAKFRRYKEGKVEPWR